ncbi:hypothetical protein [Acinetobacter guerrae]|uniref:hypothetical protein n=1 Tax=Acinetobacter guerrae TaxID=1843371 RepID=UPI00128DF059|nr:hypothetical protein [Acinetobacter guerrae]MPW45199.1 hypothetical protein [Acinetobacter guerrae]
MEFKKLYLAISLALVGSFSNATGLTNLTDKELSEQTGQALFNLSYIAPGASGNTDANNTGVGFYKLGMEATVELNANIKKLQLGCGGMNGAGGCDIDIDNMSLSGNADTREGRAGSSAVLTNPFIQFAIKNPNSASTRSIAGFRLSAEDIVGLLTFGDNNGTPNGINSLSGYLKTQATNGTTYTTASNPSDKSTLFGTSASQIVSGLLNISAPLCTAGCGKNPYNGFSSDPSNSKTTGLVIPSLRADYNVPASTVSGNRMKSVVIQGVETTKIQDMNLTYDSGALHVNLNTCVSVIAGCWVGDTTFNMQATITGVKAKINFEENMGYIHKLPLSGGGFYLGLQNQAIHWPGAASDDIALPGWWMSFANPVDLGVLNTPDGYTVDFSSAYPQIANALSVALSQNPTAISGNEAVGALLTGGIKKDMGIIDLSSQPPALINLTSVPLSNAAQGVTPNCYGSLKFC